uniref:Mirror-image polydactyly 1 n=1 Tax=Sinocyclocheilus anshuiensis TaxID=1608454 RepID=A0A671LB86_9TELE
MNSVINLYLCLVCLQLQDRLALKEKELETKLLDSQLQEAEQEACASERAAALVEEIYKAQRERDQAVMARLHLANEERDEALLRAKKLQEATLELENIKPEESDVDLEELLNRVNSADSALAIEQSGTAIIEQIQRARERRSQITSEEMKAVIEERDAALTRPTLMQILFKRFQKSYNHICPPVICSLNYSVNIISPTLQNRKNNYIT